MHGEGVVGEREFLDEFHTALKVVHKETIPRDKANPCGEMLKNHTTMLMDGERTEFHRLDVGSEEDSRMLQVGKGKGWGIAPIKG